MCGRPGKEVIFAEPGYGAAVKTGYAWSGWSLPVYYARASNEAAELELTVPKGAAGLVRVYRARPGQLRGRAQAEGAGSPETIWEPWRSSRTGNGWNTR